MMTTDPTPTACEQVMATLAKMTLPLTVFVCCDDNGNEYCEIMEANGNRFDIYASVDTLTTIVAIVNVAPVLAADYLREKARADAAEAEVARLRFDLLKASMKRAALAQKGTQHG